MSLEQFRSNFTSSDSNEVSRSRDADVKPTLIKCLYKILVLLIITVLVAFPFNLEARVPELQGPTYSPNEDWSMTATSTQPDPDRSLTTSKDFVLTSTPAPTVRTELNSKEYVVEEILKVFPDAPIMVEVARCESGLDPLADRKNLNVDVGLFQINQVHITRLGELGLDRRDLHDNLTYARMLYDANGLNDWLMSKHCWS